jgi:hypothetical protein
MRTGSVPVIHGYVVVRKPEQSFDEQQRGAFRGGPPCKGKLCYRGIDRMPWFDIDEALYASNLPARLRDLRQRIDDANSDFTGVELSPSKEDALELLRFSNRADERCELIAISSDELAYEKNLIGQPASGAMWLGYDVVLRGGWSLIGDWIFRGPASSAESAERLNGAGLLDSPFDLPSFVSAYEAAVERGEAEEIPGPEWTPMTLGIGDVEAGDAM